MIAKVIVFLPLLSFIIVGLLKRNFVRSAGIIASSLITISAVLSCFVFYKVIFNASIEEHIVFSWLSAEGLSVNWSIYIDSITAVMLVVISVISALVHVYSIGYMEYDHNLPKFMSLISLFTFFMLVLVISNNILQLFFGWEGVGLSSYLLTGYWYKKASAYKAAIKTFLINRVADVCFAIGIFTIYFTFDSLVFTEIFKNTAAHANDSISILGINMRSIDFICFMLFIGCMGKSAQIFFHTWLSDSTEGPAPVQALIHSATMVTAGVFLVVRCSPLFEYSEVALEFITIIGAVTCLFAATIALVQNDIKRVIAYSTCSQFGYMFFACGVSAYDAAMFHLMTHAFFKALLFLGAGNIVHAMMGERDIRKMGGMYEKTPLTCFMMTIGFLALSGIFPFAGYFSMNAIIKAAYAKNTAIGEYAYSLGVVTVCCTSFYSFRLLILTFYGSSRYPASLSKNINEAPLVMLAPVSILAFVTLFLGIIGQYLFNILDSGEAFWGNAIYVAATNNLADKVSNLSWLVKLSSSISAVIGIIIAYIFYVYRTNVPAILKNKFQFLYAVLLNRYYFDEIYEFIFVMPLKRGAEYLTKLTEAQMIDAEGVNKFAIYPKKCSEHISRFQSGLIYNYVLVMVIGIILIASWYFIAYFL
jgi:NADH-quinone oxidoreductase subunit L